MIAPRIRIVRRVRAKVALEQQLDAALAERRAKRAERSTASRRGAETRRSKLWRDPIYSEMVEF